MGSLTNSHKTMTPEQSQVSVIMVPFPAQGHLNQMLQLSCLISSFGLPVHYVGSAVHNRQAKVRVNALNPLQVAKIHFHDLPIPPFASPPPNPKSSHKFPTQLQPAWDATLSLRQPLADYMRDMASKYKRVVIIHDFVIAVLVQDVISIPNAEQYSFNSISAFCQARLAFEQAGKPFPLEIAKDLPPVSDCISEGLQAFLALQTEPLSYRAGDIHNTCRSLESPFLDILESEEVSGNRKSWAIGPFSPRKFASSETDRHRCLKWLDKQEPNSVIYVTFGTTTSLSDEEVIELANGLERSQQKFLWVLRDADKGDVFDGDVRRVELPEGFENRVEGRGMVERDWAPQPEILAHVAVGGFLSHCGWNSCVESITMGVPLVAWPMHSDQPTSAVLITEVLKVGLALRKFTVEGGEVVKAVAIQTVVRRLMASEEGAEIRKRAEDLAVVVRRATEEGGESRVELESFIAHITRQND